MKLRAIILIAVLAVTGIAVAFRSGVTGYQRPDEAWLAAQLPEQIDGYTVVREYKMDDSTYEALKPIGIVSRYFGKGGDHYDVVVISGDEPNTFHDQTWCFRTQNWKVEADKTVQTPTQRFGNVPMRLINVVNDTDNRWMVFVFRGPSGGFYSDFGGMWRDTFMSDLRTGAPTPTSFLRVIGLTGQTPEQVAAFSAKAIDADAMPIGMGKGK